MPKVDVESDLPKLEKTVDGLDKEVKKLATAQKKKYAEFETLNNALYEGKDVIAESQKALKKEKDAKKIKQLAEEIEAQETTFKKISAKVPGIRKELEGMSTDGAKLLKDLKDANGEIAALQKALMRTAGDVGELKAMSKTLKDLEDTVSKASESATLIADTGLPNTPKL